MEGRPHGPPQLMFETIPRPIVVIHVWDDDGEQGFFVVGRFLL